jgi:hypothetical protein
MLVRYAIRHTNCLSISCNLIPTPSFHNVLGVIIDAYDGTRTEEKNSKILGS